MSEELDRQLFDAVKKMVPHIVESIDRRGFEYARMIAADIGKIVRNENPKPTQEDFTESGRKAKEL